MIENNIKKIRTKNNWTQEEFANKVGISRQAVISIEKGKYTPSLELAFKISKVFEMPITELFIQKEE
ncbi:helix-turn-helix transcriptional regulator [Lactococcus lactis]|uniref:helix-turn-helix transcriptional regulator n=1 Tax=Lactococcus lactis TaxID=1358 RepID=UPI002053600A|nr:helix-turn-helix transcriptional regulator [Lactococcus lactis]MDG4973402.1 helix-turn-helix transcriptional regulator [Lactococcus lactis]MDT2872223.1 helix-turn-helix transcriptional regulator [Lactococcus lactis]MDT2933728.1 helix-turn-helix transcriptional regulator [Lactococcus lactis]BDH82204.1 transcriptional regulator [Lactococcus lactis]